MVQLLDATLIVDGKSFEQFVRSVGNARSSVGCGPARVDLDRYPARILVEKLQSMPRDPSGSDFAPLAMWCAVCFHSEREPLDAHYWRDRLRPSFAQTLVVLLLGIGSQRSGWLGWIFERGSISRIASVQIAGAKSTRLGQVSPEDDLFKESTERWSRLAPAVGSAFSELRSSHVALIGCSRTGTLAATMLSALGIRRLSIIDGDHIELHNLDGMYLAHENDLGQNKAKVTARHLHAFRPSMAISIGEQSLGSRAFQPVIGSSDLIVTCVDQDLARLHAAEIAAEKMVPHLDIGTSVVRDVNGQPQMVADVRWLLPGDGCVQCVGGVEQTDRMAFLMRSPRGSLFPKRPEPWQATRVGSLITNNAVAVSIGIQTWLKYLRSELRSSVWHRIVWTSGGGVQTETLQKHASKNCPLCQRSVRNELAVLS